MLEQALFLTSVFGSVGAAAYALAQRIFDTDEKRISDRLSDTHRRKNSKIVEEPKMSPFKRLSTWAAKPFIESSGEGAKVNSLRAKLAMAGIYDPAAIRSVIGWKFLLLSAGVLVGYIVGGMYGFTMLGVAAAGLAGYMAPTMWLGGRIKENQVALNQGLPDALDLMVICVESGLTVDGTMQRVGEELQMAHPAVSREFGICHTESRLGVSRGQSFKNLASRTGNVNLQSLTAMLIQADRFGTSVALALRVQAESMRTKRQLAAEEMAAKASVKMSFPLVLFIFPATFIVMMGPMIVQFMTSSSL